MNYQKIHDEIISRALSRQKDATCYYESHHILPKCEGGVESGPKVFLTFKEHRLVHMLRYKITGIYGNLWAHNFMCLGEAARIENAKVAARLSHSKFKERDSAGYYARQKKAGHAGGDKCAAEKIGIHSLPEEIKQNNRMKGVRVIMEKKLGIFDPIYMENFRISLFKPVSQPKGIFNQMTEAAAANGCCPASVTYRVNQTSPRFQNWFYVKEEK